MTRGIMEVRSKNQVTLPKALASVLHIQEGDLLEYSVEEGKIVITPKVMVPKDQVWFWTEEWQQAEREVQEELYKKGHGKSYTAKGLLKEIMDAEPS